MDNVLDHTDSSLLRLTDWEVLHPSLVVGFTTRKGGVSHSPFKSLNMGLHVPDRPEAIIKNRKILAEKISFPLEHWVMGEQTHSDNIHILDMDDKGRGSYNHNTALKDIDGLITNKKGLLCTAFFADCVPLFFFDPVTGYIGIAHAGWKGTTNNIAKKMVENLVELGVERNNIRGFIGPSISQENYEVDENVINQVDVKYREKVIMTSHVNQYMLDLKELNKQILLDSGLKESNIKVSNLCTFEHQNLFFSHRRDKGKTGRMLGFIGYRT